jgi:hypothetical protein
MKKIVQLKKRLEAILLIILCCSVALIACKKKDSPIDTAPVKEAKFSATVNGAAVSGAGVSDDSFITTNDEFTGAAYAEIHIAGTNTTLEIMIENPTVKQYDVTPNSNEASLILTVNDVMCETTSTSVLNITEATASKISGTISGAFKNLSSGATVTVSNGSFSSQF